MSSSLATIAVIGGTGALGAGLAARWAAAGHRVVIGSRSAEKAVAAAAGLAASTDGPAVNGMANPAAAAAAEIVVVTVPFANQEEILREIEPAVHGKIVVDATVPLVPPRVATVHLPVEGSAAQRAQAILGEGARVVSAFHNIAAHKLGNSEPIDCDVLVFGDKAADREAVIGLVEALGIRGLHGGPLANSAAAEAMTSVLIGINRRYKIDDAGIRITIALDGAPDRDVGGRG